MVRPACPGDVSAIHGLLRRYAAQGALLPRTRREIAAAIDCFVVVTDELNRVRACAALSVYSASLGEVTAVAVAPSARGTGLGTMAVRGVEAMARTRGLTELFALTNAEAFFESLGYVRGSVELYPEKLARYETLRAAGVQVVERSCYRKVTGEAKPEVPLRQSRPRRETRPTG